MAQRLKCLPPMQETQVRSLGWEDPLEKEMVTHSSILAWRMDGEGWKWLYYKQCTYSTLCLAYLGHWALLLGLSAPSSPSPSPDTPVSIWALFSAAVFRIPFRITHIFTLCSSINQLHTFQYLPKSTVVSQIASTDTDFPIHLSLMLNCPLDISCCRSQRPIICDSYICCLCWWAHQSATHSVTRARNLVFVSSSFPW